MTVPSRRQTPTNDLEIADWFDSPFDRHQPCGAHLAQDVPYHVAADAWRVALDLGDTEGAHASGDSGADLLGLGALERGDAFLELSVSADEDAPEVIEPWMSVVRIVMPAARASLERLVVRDTRLLDDAFETDVAADAVVEVIEQQQREQAGHTARVGLNRTRTTSPALSRSTMSLSVFFHRPPAPGW